MRHLPTYQEYFAEVCRLDGWRPAFSFDLITLTTIIGGLQTAMAHPDIDDESRSILREVIASVAEHVGDRSPVIAALFLLPPAVRGEDTEYC